MTLEQQITSILEHAEAIGDITDGTVLDYHCEDCGDTFWCVRGGKSQCPYCGGGDTHEC